MIDCDVTDKKLRITRLPVIKVYRENSRTIGLKFNNIDITGSIVYFTVKQRPDDTQSDDTAIIKKDIATHLDPINGYTAVTLTPSDTDKPAAEYQYDIKLKRPDGRQDTIGVGLFIVAPVITNRS